MYIDVCRKLKSWLSSAAPMSRSERSSLNSRKETVPSQFRSKSIRVSFRLRSALMMDSKTCAAAGAVRSKWRDFREIRGGQWQQIAPHAKCSSLCMQNAEKRGEIWGKAREKLRKMPESRLTRATHSCRQFKCLQMGGLKSTL